jgi:hypothetical protein
MEALQASIQFLAPGGARWGTVAVACFLNQRAGPLAFRKTRGTHRGGTRSLRAGRCGLFSRKQRK